MKKLSIVLSVLLALGLLVSMVGCAEPAEPVEEKAPLIEEKAPPVKEKAPVVKEKAPPKEEKEAPPVEEVWEWPKTLRIGTNPLGATYYTLTVAWAPVMEEKTGMKIRVAPEGSTSARARFLKTGMVDIGNDILSIYGTAMEATGGMATRDGGPYAERQVWIVTPSLQGFHVLGDSEIKTIYDIKPGHRIAYFTVPAGIIYSDALLAWIQLDKEDITVANFGSFSGMAKSIMEGKADVSWSGPTTTVAVELSAGPHGLRWLDLPYDEDPEGAKRFIEVRPASEWTKATAGVEGARGVRMNAVNGFYTTMADKDPELIYQFCKWLDENFDAYKDKHPRLPQMTLDNFGPALGNMPVHEGAIRYLKEKGKWTEAMEARQEYNVAVQNAYIKAYAEAIDMADDKGVRVDPENEEWIKLWENYKKELGLPRVRSLVETPAKPWPWAK